MSFVVRQIARTADGRAIVRPRTIDAERLTIGRATASDIHLADLAVTLDHATIRRVAPDRIVVATDKKLPFTVNGRAVAEAGIALSSGAEIRFGGHRLLVSRDGGTGEPRIDVERVDPLLDAVAARDEARAFSLAGRLPGKRGMSWTLVVLILALFVARPMWTAFRSGGFAARAGTVSPADVRAAVGMPGAIAGPAVGGNMVRCAAVASSRAGHRARAARARSHPHHRRHHHHRHHRRHRAGHGRAVTRIVPARHSRLRVGAPPVRLSPLPAAPCR